MVQGIDLRHDAGELPAHNLGFSIIGFSDNLRDLSVGHTRVRVHGRLVKLVALNIARGIDVHLTDHAQTILLGYQ